MMLFLCRVCGLEFQKLVADPPPSEVRCKAADCGGQAKQRASAGARITSSLLTSGPTPQHTGLSYLDHDVDRVIAKDADMRIQEMQGRQREKMALMEREGVEGDRLSRLSDGDYFVLSEEQRKAAKRARVLHMQALDQTPGDVKYSWPQGFKVKWPK